jgi:hypothetical protein
MQWRHFGPAHLFGGCINPIRQLVVLAGLGQDLRELSLGRKILHRYPLKLLLFSAA